MSIGKLRGVASGGAIIDLFAGPGGWDIAARDLGLDVLGVELDDVACRTREAAGLVTAQADVAALDPAGFLFGGKVCDGLIASPPCQAWSMAGKRGGERDKPLVYRALADLERGADTRADLRCRCEDPRSLLVVEPLRWALALQPTWVALEQVPPVLELWREYAQILRLKGWRAWTGILSAERYGVPQTRRRAILMAHRDRDPAPPQPTHQAYVPGEPAREEHTLEGVLLSWVSMADALGWGGNASERPARTVCGDRSPRWAYGEGDSYATGWTLRTGTNSMKHSRDADDIVPYERPVSDPAPTVDGKVGKSWKVAPEGEHQWPATTVNDDPRISRPGHHDENESGSQQKDAIRVTEQEAAILQGFPADYPFQGSRTKRFEQIGNAVPPPLARAILAELAGEQAPTLFDGEVRGDR